MSAKSDWVVAIVVVKFDEKLGQQVCAMYPSDSLSDAVINDIKVTTR